TSLPSFDETMPAADANAAMNAQGSDVAGVQSNGSQIGFIETSTLENGTCRDFVQAFDDSLIVAEATPLAALVLRLNEQRRMFVTVRGQVAAVVSRDDFHKPAARMWLFGMVTLLEMRMSRLIDRFCTGNDWQQFLSPGRIRKAEGLLAERTR